MATPRSLADEDLRHSILTAAHRLEPTLEFATVVGLGMAAATDAEILDFATLNHWLVVSHDVNTMKATAEARIAARAGLSGLFLVAQARPNRVIVEHLLLIWAASSLEEW